MMLAWFMSYFLMASFSQSQSQKYDAFFLDAICQREKGHSDAAFDLLRHCIEIDSTRSEAYYYLAQYYAGLRQREKALAYSKKAVELEPDNATYLETLANAYIGQKQYEDAIVTLERLYDKNRDREEVLAFLIQLYEQKQDYANAIADPPGNHRGEERAAELCQEQVLYADGQ